MYGRGRWELCKIIKMERVSFLYGEWQWTQKIVFKTVVTLQQNENLNAFKKGMYDMIRNVEFANIRNEFLDRLSADIKSIWSS